MSLRKEWQQAKTLASLIENFVRMPDWDANTYRILSEAGSNLWEKIREEVLKADRKRVREMGEELGECDDCKSPFELAQMVAFWVKRDRRTYHYCAGCWLVRQSKGE